MGKLQEFLMNREREETVTSQVKIGLFPEPFTVKSITEGENKEIKKSCQKVSFDKKTHQKTVDLDTDLYNNRLAIQDVNGFTDDINELRDEAKN